MSTTEGRSSDQSTRKTDLKLEVVVISVSDVDRAKQFYGTSGGGWTPTFHSITASASSSSPRPAQGARFNSARR